MNSEGIRGLEFDWFATDADGCIGHFATAGFGVVPGAVLARLDDLRHLDEQVLKLPVIAEATAHLPGSIEDWLEMARRGLFAYDWQHWCGPYRRAATPSRALRITDLPTVLADALRIVEWPDVRFAEMREVRPEALCACR